VIDARGEGLSGESSGCSIKEDQRSRTRMWSQLPMTGGRSLVRRIGAVDVSISAAI
jgi:hypothetical protein